ncbi:hypothetical protein NOF04DRAFT_1314151 [Fusarium oxysporum II5]|nr:hypothetical protein NOF04DRAFT_1314151 [Fusarium oxysporum II5]
MFQLHFIYSRIFPTSKALAVVELLLFIVVVTDCDHQLFSRLHPSAERQEANRQSKPRRIGCMLQFLSFLSLETPILALSDVSCLITTKVVCLNMHPV